jgi:hypothetical protein
LREEESGDEEEETKEGAVAAAFLIFWVLSTWHGRYDALPDQRHSRNRRIPDFTFTSLWSKTFQNVTRKYSSIPVLFLLKVYRIPILLKET